MIDTWHSEGEHLDEMVLKCNAMLEVPALVLFNGCNLFGIRRKSVCHDYESECDIERLCGVFDLCLAHEKQRDHHDTTFYLSITGRDRIGARSISQLLSPGRRYCSALSAFARARAVEIIQAATSRPCIGFHCDRTNRSGYD